LSTGLEKRPVFLRYRAPALAYAMLIFAISSLPSSMLPKSNIFSFDKIAHFLEFGLFGIFLFRAFRYPEPRGHPVLLTFAAGILWAGLDEIHQYFVPGRQCDIGDFAADAAGLFFFTVLSSLLNPVQRLSVENP